MDKSIICERSFPASYNCIKLEEIPNGNYTRHYFSHGNREKDGLIFKLDSGSIGYEWVGMFAFGDIRMKALSGSFSMPNCSLVSIVSKGAGYLVDVKNPDAWIPISSQPITSYAIAMDLNIIVFGSLTYLTAYGISGLLWRSNHLSYDDLRIDKIDGNLLLGSYDDLSDEETRYKVDLKNGRILES